MLDPKLSDADLYQLIDTVTACFFDLPDPAGKDDQVELIERVLKSFRSLLSVVIEKDTSSACLQSLLKQIIRFMTSPKANQRLWMMSSYEHMLKSYLENLTVKIGGASPVAGADPTATTAKAAPAAQSLEGLGKFIADLVPRCTDPELHVRRAALEGIRYLLKIQATYHLKGNENDAIIDAVNQLRDRADTTDSTAQFALVNDLSKVLSKKIAAEELLNFLYPLIDCLLDAQSTSSSGTCVVINGLFRQRGIELEAEVPNLVNVLHKQMGLITHERASLGILRSLRTLATHYLALVVKQLQTFDLPYDKYVVDIWQALAADENLAPRILEILMDILNTTRPYEEADRPKGSRAPMPKTAIVSQLKATCGVTELFAVEETGKLAQAHYALVLSTLFTRVASCVGVNGNGKSVSPIDDAIDAFQSFAKRSESTFIFDEMDEDAPVGFGAVGVSAPVSAPPTPTPTAPKQSLKDAQQQPAGAKPIGSAPSKWDLLKKEETFVEGLTYLSKAIALHAPTHVPALFQSFVESIKRVYELQRVAACAFFAELINQQCGGHLDLLNNLKNNLLTKLVDQSHLVRMLCIRGLGNIASIPDDQMKKHTTAVLSAMVTGMDDRDDPNDDITLEAMNGLSKIIAKIEEDTVRAILLNIALRIRPCFEKDKPQVRAAAFRLFGNLSRFGDGPSKEPFLEQIHANFMSLLLHLNEADAEVRLACKVALKQIGPLLESTKTNEMFQKHLVDDGTLQYGDFMNDLSKIMIGDLDDKINFYVMSNISFFKSERVELKANAAIFTGFLLGNLHMSARKYITKEHVCGELIRLLRDPAVVVRIRAAEAMSLLHEY
eukprot:m.888514 g.888514  ORF g.888514 m.888514 type:complete len:837 (+) comp59932_c0_seq4:158-2668(+)